LPASILEKSRIQDFQEVFGGIFGGDKKALLFPGNGRGQQQFEHSQYAIHGRADLVTHVGQELAFSLIGFLGQLLAPPQLFLHALHFGERRRHGPALATQLKLIHDQPRQGAQRFLLFEAQEPRATIDHTEGSQTESLPGPQRSSGIKSNARIARHQRIVRKSRITLGIGDNEEFLLQNCVGAKGHIERRFCGLDSDARLEPLAVGVDQADQGDGRAANGRGQPREVIEALFRERVQQFALSQRFQSLRFMRRIPAWSRRRRFHSVSVPVRCQPRSNLRSNL
jgi:hypothetical protein